MIGYPRSKKSSTILIVLEHASHFYHYRSIIRELCERGHAVKVLFGRDFKDRWLDPINKFKENHQNFEYSRAVYRTGITFQFLLTLRAILNYRRFLLSKDEPRFYRDRLKGYLPFWLKPLIWFEHFNINFFLRSESVAKVLRALDNMAPPDRRILAQLKEYKPDVLFVSSGDLPNRSPQPEYVRAARSLGVKSAFFVTSWDYLEIKGVIPVLPDVLLVWNETQKETAIRDHGVEGGTIRISGGAMFDDFFSTLKPSCTKAQFRARHGLRPDDPMVLYLGSSPTFFKKDLELLGILQKAVDQYAKVHGNPFQIVVRPHPQNDKIYQSLAKDDKNIALIPRKGDLPDTVEGTQLFYDTLYYSDAVIGVNTSAFIYALIVGKPIATILVDVDQEIIGAPQAQAPHFKQLLESGAISVAENKEQLVEIVAKLVEGKDELRAEREAFLKKYIRPRGLTTTACEVVTRQLECLIAERQMVSIGLVTRNRDFCIRSALDSLLGQTYRNIELIIVDGASIDTTPEICRAYAAQDSRVRYIRKEINEGMINDTAQALSEARGKYFMWASDDDWWDSTFVQTMVETLEAHPDYGVAMSYFSDHATDTYNAAMRGRVHNHDYTHKSHYEVYQEIMASKINPIFWFGLYRREDLISWFRRRIPHCIEDANVYMYELALTTKFYSVPLVLHSKYRDPLPAKIRHPHVGGFYADRFAYTRYIVTILTWLLSSPNIPFSRKRLMFVPWFKKFWKFKRRILKELFHGLFGKRIMSKFAFMRIFQLAGNSIDRRDIRMLTKWLHTNPQLTKGSLTAAFEKRWAAWLGRRYGVFCNSGSSANLLMAYAAFIAGGLPNKKVIVPAVGWGTAIAPFMQFGFEPMMCGADPENFGLNLIQLEKLLKEHSPALVMVPQVLGVPADMDALLALQRTYGFMLLEDAGVAMGAEFRGKKIGSFGEMSSASFYFGHQLSTIEGGMVGTDSKALYDILLMLRSHGLSRDLDGRARSRQMERYGIDDFHEPFTFFVPAFNVCGTEIGAYLGMRQMEKADTMVAIRKRNHRLYAEHLTSVSFQKWDARSEPCGISFGAVARSVAHRKRIIQTLNHERIETGLFSAGNLGRHPFWSERYGIFHDAIADMIHDRGFVLPNNESLRPEDVLYICKVVNSVPV